jgi:hypothetical protein
MTQEQGDKRTREKRMVVRVKPFTVIYDEGRSYGAGQRIELPAADARQLLEDGVAEREE